MRRLVFVFLVSSLLLTLTFVQKGNIPAVKASSSIYQGDLILTGNNVTVIEGRFDINGSIIVEENATLILRNALLNFTQVASYQFNMTFLNPVNGNPRLVVENATIASNHYALSVMFFGNSSASINKLTASGVYLLTSGSSVASISNSTVGVMYPTGFCVINMSNSFVSILSTGEHSSIDIFNCTVGALWAGGGHIDVSNSTISSELDVFGYSTVRISGSLDMNGNINVEGNAGLTLEDAIVNFTQTHNEEFNMTLLASAELRVTNATITSNYVFILYFYGNSSATVNNLNMPVTLARLYAFDFSVLDLNAFTSRYLRAFNSSIINLSNSAPFYLRSYGTSAFNISNSTIRKQYAFNSSEVTVSQSDYIVDLRGYDSSLLYASDSTINSLYTYQQATVWLVNSTYSNYGIQDQSNVYVYWYLDVHVIDSIGQDVPSANVTATYPNATVAESKLTDANGWTRLTLMEKMMNVTGSYPVGNYTVTAEYEVYMEQQSVNMTDNKEITITLPFIIPEFPSFLILPLFMIATLLAAIVYRRKHTMQH